MMKPSELHTIVMASNLTNSVFNIVLLLSKASSTCLWIKKSVFKPCGQHITYTVDTRYLDIPGTLQKC